MKLSEIIVFGKFELKFCNSFIQIGVCIGEMGIGQSSEV